MFCVSSNKCVQAYILNKGYFWTICTSRPWAGSQVWVLRFKPVIHMEAPKKEGPSSYQLSTHPSKVYLRIRAVLRKFSGRFRHIWLHRLQVQISNWRSTSECLLWLSIEGKKGLRNPAEMIVKDPEDAEHFYKCCEDDMILAHWKRGRWTGLANSLSSKRKTN